MRARGSELLSYFRGLAPSWRARFPDGGLTPGCGDAYDRNLAFLQRMAVRRFPVDDEHAIDWYGELAASYLRGTQLRDLL